MLWYSLKGKHEYFESTFKSIHIFWCGEQPLVLAPTGWLLSRCHGLKLLPPEMASDSLRHKGSKVFNNLKKYYNKYLCLPFLGGIYISWHLLGLCFWDTFKRLRCHSLKLLPPEMASDSLQHKGCKFWQNYQKFYRFLFSPFFRKLTFLALFKVLDATASSSCTKDGFRLPKAKTKCNFGRTWFPEAFAIRLFQNQLGCHKTRNFFFVGEFYGKSFYL